MARKYPRFLYSNPHNTKNKGPFVIHTLAPMTIFKVHKMSKEYIEYAMSSGKPEMFFDSKGFALELLEYDNLLMAEKIAEDACIWMIAQVALEEVTL